MIRQAKNTQHKTARSRETGSIMLLATILAALFIAIGGVGIAYCQFRSFELKHADATEAAVLTVSKDLSRIVIEDPVFGFVALTDQPGGIRTKLVSGEDMPVRGINSLTANLRQTALIAESLQSKTMQSCVADDVQSLEGARRRLVEAWSDALLPSSQSKHLARDVDGNEINLLQTATNAYRSCFGLGAPDHLQIRLQLGSFARCGRTTTCVPQPYELAKVDATKTFSGCYRSDENYPVADLDFFFAATSSEPGLVDDSLFCSAETTPSKIPSLLKLAILVTTPDKLQIQSTVCAVSPSYKVHSNHASMIIGCPPRSEGCSMADLLGLKSSAGDFVYYSSEGGDYPTDANATLKQLKEPAIHGSITATCVCDFLRSASFSNAQSLSCLLNILKKAPERGSTLASSETSWILVYFDDNGVVQELALNSNLIPLAITAQNQSSGRSDVINSLGCFQISYWDEVRNISKDNSGQHGGNPLAFDQIKNAAFRFSGTTSADSEVRCELLAKLHIAAQIVLIDGDSCITENTDRAPNEG